MFFIFNRKNLYFSKKQLLKNSVTETKLYPKLHVSQQIVVSMRSKNDNKRNLFSIHVMFLFSLYIIF